jgi:hypothetical protein
MAGNRRGFWATVLPESADCAAWAWLAHASSAVVYWHRASTTEPGKLSTAALDWQRAVEANNQQAENSNAIADSFLMSAE